MAASRSRILLFIAVPAMILLLPLSIYFVDSAAASDKVARNVSIAGVDVARQTEIEAIAAVDEYATVLTERVTTIVVNGTQFELDPDDVGLTFDSSSAVLTALGLRKDGIGDWITAFSEEVDVPLSASLDDELVEAKLVEWEQVAIPNPAFEGSVSILNGVVSHEYPKEGEAVSRDVATDLLLEALQSDSDTIVDLPIVTTTPKLTDSDIDAGVKEARKIISRGVVLTNDEYGFEFHVDAPSLGRALHAEVVDGDHPSIEFTIDPGVITALVETVREGLEIEPVDAHWETILVDDFEGFPDQYEIKDSDQEDVEGLPEDDTIALVAGLNGTTVDAAEITAAVEEAALGNGKGHLPIVKNAEPDFTTAMAEEYGELYELAEFTTWTPGTNRVHNIQLMADIVDETIVWPGEEFSVNEKVGRRTLEKGFKYDCAIVGGELSCEQDPVNVGGGVSQFGTTIFNAIYFSCLEDVAHQPHSIYFRKYPEGREATLGYPHPDVAFKNDTEAPVIIRTRYTPRTITVTFFGDNGGITCGTERGDRTGHRSASVLYRADETGSVAPGEEYIENKGSGGWSIVNTRIFYDVDGNEIERERFPWTYRGEKQVILMHPCEPKVGGDGVCPISVPVVTGLPKGDALAAIAGAGFNVEVVEQPTTVEAENGIVLSYGPDGFQDAGVTITITVGKWEPPDED
ncbi:MAG: VanW family protein [Actinomycetota bacterium]